MNTTYRFEPKMDTAKPFTVTVDDDGKFARIDGEGLMHA